MEGLIFYPFLKQEQPSTSKIPTIQLEQIQKDNNHGANYLTFASVLLLPLLIGIIYSKCVGFRRKLRVESESNYNLNHIHGSFKENDFLIGNHTNSVLSAGLTFYTGFLSSVAIIGYPVELFEHGIQPFLFILFLIPIALVYNYLFVPVYFNMELSSTYEYFERRFSRSVRVFVGTLGWIQMIAYMALVVFGTSVWLESLTNLNMKIWSGFLVFFSICTCYLASYNSLQWICSIQAMSALALVISLLTLGILEIKDYKNLWNLWTANHKLNFYNFDINPETDYTIWTSTVGSIFLWFSFYSSNYVQLQRIISVKDTKSGKRSVLLGTFITTIFMMILILIGLLAFAHICGKENHIRPGESLEGNATFLSMYYINLLQILPGLYGFFLAAIISLTLSTVSSHLNSTVTLMTCDYLKYWIPELSVRTEVIFSRLLLVFIGIIIFTISVVFSALYNNTMDVLLLLWFLCAISNTTISGVLSLGLFFPWSNSKGSIIGMISSIALITYIMTFSGIYNLDMPSQSQNNVICGASNSLNHYLQPNKTLLLPVFVHATNTSRKLFSLSYFWYPAISYVTTLFAGLLFSIMFIKFQRKISVAPECLSPPILKLWLKFLPPSISRIWIDPDEHLSLISSSVFAFIPRSLERESKKEVKTSPTNCDIEIKPAYNLTNNINNNNNY